MIDVDHLWIYKRIVMPLDCCLCYNNIGIVACLPVEETLGGSNILKKKYYIRGTMSDATHWLFRLVDIILAMLSEMKLCIHDGNLYYI
jgi:hypothetical protein